jgi:hypothetical protein
MFHQLPHEIDRLIGSYLDYESRMNFNRVLPDVNDRFVRKLPSDAHNLHVKVDLIRHKLTQIQNEYTMRRRFRLLKQLCLYILHTKDTALSTSLNQEFYDALQQKTRQILQLSEGMRFLTASGSEFKSFTKVCIELFSYIENRPPPTLHISPALVEIV